MTIFAWFSFSVFLFWLTCRIMEKTSSGTGVIMCILGVCLSIMLFIFGISQLCDTINLGSRKITAIQQRQVYVDLATMNESLASPDYYGGNVFLYEQIIKFNEEVRKANSNSDFWRGILFDSAYRDLDPIPTLIKTN